MEATTRHVYTHELFGASGEVTVRRPTCLLTQTMPGGQCLLEFLDGKGALAFALRFEDARALWIWLNELYRVARRHMP